MDISAPEIMLTFRQYTKAIDVWSVGCILAEVLSGGRPLFPGRDYHHQITLILDVLGTPTIEEFAAISSRRSRDYIRSVSFTILPLEDSFHTNYDTMNTASRRIDRFLSEGNGHSQPSSQMPLLRPLISLRKPL